MNYIDYISKANEEFKQNGRSEKFIKYEHRVIEKGGPIQQYWFARYVKGADIERFQDIMLKKAPYNVAFYFTMHVSGANASPFIFKAGREKDLFWARKFVEAGKSRKHEGVSYALSQLKNFGIKLELVSGYGNLETIILNANKTYEKYGRNEFF